MPALVLFVFEVNQICSLYTHTSIGHQDRFALPLCVCACVREVEDKQVCSDSKRSG